MDWIQYDAVLHTKRQLTWDYASRTPKLFGRRTTGRLGWLGPLEPQHLHANHSKTLCDIPFCLLRILPEFTFLLFVFFSLIAFLTKLDH
jgi:hypothetical protein